MKMNWKYLPKKRSQRGKEYSRHYWLRLILFLLVTLMTAVGSGCTKQEEAPAPVEADFPVEISVDEAYREYQSGTFFLDVREQDEWNEYHIPGTTLISLKDLSARLDELPQGQKIIVVCRSGNRSQSGRDILLYAGFTQVTSMTGGVSTWRSLNYPIEP